MRILLAGIFVYGVMMGTIGLIDSYFDDQEWPWWTTPLPGIVMLAALIVAIFVFNRSGNRPSLRRRTLPEIIADLETKGLLTRQKFRATRAFSLKEFEDEGPHYFIELDNGLVLYLNGQYLYNYEPIEDDPEMNQARSFPCTEFEILRHKKEGYVVDIVCSGTVLEPEVIASPFTVKDIKYGIPDDGNIISDKTYDKIKNERISVA